MREFRIEKAIDNPVSWTATVERTLLIPDDGWKMQASPPDGRRNCACTDELLAPTTKDSWRYDLALTADADGPASHG